MTLGEITAVCADTRDLNLALVAVERMAEAGVGHIVLATDADGAAFVAPRDRTGAQIVESPTLQTADDYSRFVLERLPDLVPDEVVMVFQWDGFIIDPHLWSEDFLAHDYIGAPWPTPIASPCGRVGNGGFSLRSRRLMEAALTLPPRPLDYPEDRHLIDHLPQLESAGIRVAPLELARRFAIEHHPPYPTKDPERLAPPFEVLGFHGWCNMHLAYDDAGLLRYVDEVMTPAQRRRILIDGTMFWLIVYLVHAGRPQGALELGRRVERELGPAVDLADPDYLRKVTDRLLDELRRQGVPFLSADPE